MADVARLWQLKKDHARLLQEYRHVRYMWIPHTDTVVVVISNPFQVRL
jgi:L-galactono-1,4-lactone dehydrogenase